MRTFLDIQHAYGLKKFFDHPLGTTYYSPVRPRVAPIHVRHFDSALPPTMIGAFVDLIRATQQWVTRHPELARLVQVKQISEVGVDFVSRHSMEFTTPRHQRMMIGMIRPSHPASWPRGRVCHFLPTWLLSRQR